MSHNQLRRSPEGMWETLSHIAVKGAEYNSPERQPHPKCLEGTRMGLLDCIYRLLDDRKKSRLIWLHGTAGVGKSAVAFTVAENMRSLKIIEQMDIEKRLAGTFFFSRKHTERCTTAYFFVTLAYQLACNFPSIQEDLNRAICQNPALLHPNKSLRDQMEGLFLKPLRKLQFRLRGCPPLVFVVDALDECMSETEAADLISLLSEALRQPGLPVVHVLLTSRSEEHIREIIQEKEPYTLVQEIPVETTVMGVIVAISLDGADVDCDIRIFLEHSFRRLQGRCSDFPQPTRHELARLANRAGRRFIVASTMIKFVDDGYHDPRDRLQLLLEFTSELLPGTEVYKLYDRILATCSDPTRAYLHLSIIAALANPLSISQISELLGPGEGKDVKTLLVQLRSIMDIPTNSSLPVNIFHSSVRDYVLDPLNCNLPEVQCIRYPHSLLARSCLHLMMQAIPRSTALLDALSQLKTHSRAMKPHEPQSLKQELAFIVEPPTPFTVLIALQWLRGGHKLESWPETLDGRAWLETQEGKDWLQIRWMIQWLQTQGKTFLPKVHSVRDWLLTQGRKGSLTEAWPSWLGTQSGRDWLQTQSGQDWLPTQWGKDWLQTRWGQEWLQTRWGQDWLQTRREQDSPHTQYTHDSLQTLNGEGWLETESGREWLRNESGREWLQTHSGQEWLQTQSRQDLLPTQSRQQWLQTQSGREQLKTQPGRELLQTQGGQDWLKTQSGREWLQTQSGQDWLYTPHGQAWQSTAAASVWVTLEEFSRTLEAVSEYVIIPELRSLLAFQAIQQFKSLPDFLMFPAFLALRHRDPSSALSHCRFPPDMEVFHAMMAFNSFAYEALERSRSASDALNYACQNWSFHLSRAHSPWGDMLDHLFKSFWTRHLLCWLEMQWCSKGLRSCLSILFEAQSFVLPEVWNLAKEHHR
ncbi:uncharacterized protein EDB93DRAFT_641721 [Suillus bovinus]|uniref:uncharacterized protein n=1 Tax=Suillus bovinus TaxID=48563 RepID=UPI001B86BF25|nr:uncharacterized protein EDB93DRAFT_641721 [Suillus bovinus]KAG2141181.1 hypothetical protein EDB93DRAFT_641721 [Suillus bovinus]